MLHFDPQTGLYPDEIETVREAVREDWVLAFRKDGLPDLNTEPETPAGQLIDSQTAAIADKDSEVLYLAQQFNPLTAEGIWQDALGEIYFLKRKPATSSTAVCVCTGLAGTVIKAGSVIKSTEDNSEWVCAATVTIPQGQSSVQAMFTASQPGPVTASPDTLTRIVTVTPGWDAVTNPAAAVTGSAQETQAAFENRRYNSVAANARGSVNALYGTIANLDGVLDALVLENTTSEPKQEWGVTIPGHSVWISVVGGENDDIAEAVYRKKDAGCGTAGNTQVTYQDTGLPWQPIYTYNIERPAPLAFGVRVTIRKTGSTANDITEKIRAAILADFNGEGSGALRVGMAQNVYASRFYCPVLGVGVQDLQSIEIAAPLSGGQWADRVTVNADQEPVLDADDITIIILED